MKKGIAFLLAAVMCLGFVGCGEKGNSGRINADKVFEALSQEGELVLDTKHDNTESYNSAKVPNVEMIVFRMPKEQRPTYQEQACYIEVYQTQEDLKRSAEQYAKSESDLNWLYTSGDVLLRIDGNVSSERAQKYADALKSITKENVILQNNENPKVEKSNREKTFQPPNGLGANEAYEKLKEELDGLEFSIYSYSYDSERVIFWDKSNGDWISGTVSVHTSDEEAISIAKTTYSMDTKSGLKECILVSGNVVITLTDGSEETFRRYAEPLMIFTGKAIDIDYSKMPG